MFGTVFERIEDVVWLIVYFDDSFSSKVDISNCIM